MSEKFMKNVRLFLKALSMTLRGKRVRRPYGRLLDWIERTSNLSDKVLAAADQHGFDRETREKIIVRADGRDQSMEVILSTVRYHSQEEYPYMLQDPTDHTITAIYATNMNDSYNVQRLAEAEALTGSTMHEALRELQAHLQAIPPSNQLVG
ncbi:MAG: hypothetical protein ACOCX3_00560 [Chloroflexota bacterium]